MRRKERKVTKEAVACDIFVLNISTIDNVRFEAVEVLLNV